MNIIQLIGVYTETLTFLVSLFTFHKYRHTVLKYLPLFLGLTAGLEFFCLYFYKAGNVWLYNIRTIIEFNFYAFIFWHYLNRFNRKLLFAFLVVFNSVTILNFVFGIQKFLLEPISYIYTLSYFLLVLIIIILFNQILRSETPLEGILGNLLIWFSFGSLIYYGTCLPLFSISNWVDVMGDLGQQLINILFFAVEIMNALFIIGFICSKKTYTY